jgi:hypothetical protein
LRSQCTNHNVQTTPRLGNLHQWRTLVLDYPLRSCLRSGLGNQPCRDYHGLAKPARVTRTGLPGPGSNLATRDKPTSVARVAQVHWQCTPSRTHRFYTQSFTPKEMQKRILLLCEYSVRFTVKYYMPAFRTTLGFGGATVCGSALIMR